MCGQCGVSLCELCNEYYYPSSGEEHACSTNATCEVCEKDEQIADITAKLAEAEARLRELQGSYAEAIDDIQDWAGYASDYFRDKYQLAATIERHETALVKSAAQ